MVPLCVCQHVQTEQLPRIHGQCLIDVVSGHYLAKVCMLASFISCFGLLILRIEIAQLSTYLVPRPVGEADVSVRVGLG
jgi:hypothetical protein